MAVIRHVIDAEAESLYPFRVAAWRVLPLETPVSVDHLGPLLTACRADSHPGPRLSLAGLREELNARDGRTPTGFVARAARAGQGDEIAGLAVVVEALGTAARRFSLAWLLVHPAARRQGVATALVAGALAHVRSQGGTELWAETLTAWPDAVAFWQRMAAGTMPR